MKNKIKKYIKEMIFFALAVILLSSAASYYKAMDLNKENLSIKSFKLLNMSKYIVPKDKPILLHFWATWCPTCKIEASNIEKISKDYEVITIVVQSGSKKDIEEYLKKNNLSFNVVNDKDGFYSKMFNVKVFPSTFIYDKEKNLKFSEVGYTTSAGLYSRMFLSK